MADNKAVVSVEVKATKVLQFQSKETQRAAKFPILLMAISLVN